MQHVRRVDIFQCPEDLVYKILDVVNTQTLFRVDNAVQVRLHQIGHDIHVIKVLHAACQRRHHIHNPNNIFVSEVFQKFDFAQNALGINFVTKRLRYHFNRDLCIGRRVQSRNHDTVRTGANHANERILRINSKCMTPRFERMRNVGRPTRPHSMRNNNLRTRLGHLRGRSRLHRPKRSGHRAHVVRTASRRVLVALVIALPRH
mmetsp:Transcript_10629/g.13132  ORF Transcript_10629/g.13132 Transcript_10629/m.13132 type:complete len:204 (-) Transcript_10629:434-1045(-)